MLFGNHFGYIVENRLAKARWIQPVRKPLCSPGWGTWRWKEMDTFQRYLGQRAYRTWNELNTGIMARRASRMSPQVCVGQPEVGEIVTELGIPTD